LVVAQAIEAREERDRDHFGYSMSWVFATVGLLLGDPESAQAASFPVIAPLVFASSRQALRPPASSATSPSPTTAWTSLATLARCS
jgi:hypothetical protein